jgi:hypothetical protein
MGQAGSTSSPETFEPKREFNTLDDSAHIHPTSHVVHSKLNNSSDIIDSKVVHSTLTNTTICCGANIAHSTLTDTTICGGRIKHTKAKKSCFKECDFAHGNFEDCELRGLVTAHETSKGQVEEGVRKEMEDHDGLQALADRLKMKDMEKELERERNAQTATSTTGGTVESTEGEGLGARNQDTKDGEVVAAVIPAAQASGEHAPPPYEQSTGAQAWVREKERDV